MKQTILTVLLLALFSVIQAQEDHHCGQDEAMNALYKRHPELRQKNIAQRKAIAKKIKNNPDEINAASFTIPVVFHIMHLGGPENISDAQVVDAMRILNRDYAKENADVAEVIPSMLPLADSMKIQFALATIDPDGNCTNGIIHHYDANTDWNDASPTLYDNTWDATKYMNVYVVRNITLGSGFNAAGYTYFPGSFPDGDPADAIVVLNNYFGSIGTSTNFKSRVLTHEVGHWLGLYHVFGSNGVGQDCFSDDLISDTPTTAGFGYCPDASDPSQYQLCTPGVDENFQNYMDYSYCVRMFTQEQGAAMRATLMSPVSGRDNLVSEANLIATGVINPIVPCTPIADFTCSRNKVCVGSPVTFYDASQQGTPTSYTWTMTGSSVPSSNAVSPTVTYAVPGLYSVTYVSANSAGTSASVTKTDLIEVTPISADETAPYLELFDTDVFMEGSWITGSTSGGSAWVNITNVSAGAGQNSSVVIPYANNTRQMHTWMLSPKIDLNGLTMPWLTYYYSGYEVLPSHVNAFCVSITADCGETWNELECLSGPDLVTTPFGSQDFQPVDPAEWVQRGLDLTSYASSTVQLKFEYIRDTLMAACNFYVDDINVDNFIGIKETGNESAVKVFPNPTNGEFTISWKGNAETVYVTDLTGRFIEQQQLSPALQQARLFTGSSPSAGIYFVHIVAGGKETVRKVLVH